MADTGNSRIHKFDSAGVFVKTCGTDSRHGAAQGQFSGAAVIVVDSAGFIYVADTGNEHIQKFDQNFNPKKGGAVMMQTGPAW